MLEALINAGNAVMTLDISQSIRLIMRECSSTNNTTNKPPKGKICGEIVIRPYTANFRSLRNFSPKFTRPMK